VSLLGRLEDLSLADIIQIVYLSRRTGVLEIVDDSGTHMLVFRGGLIVDASSPGQPDLNGWLETQGILDRQGIGSDVLAEAVRTRLSAMIAPLLKSTEGEFRFVLAEDAAPLKLDYDPDELFREGGLPPQKVLATTDRPLRGLEESIKAGKALIRKAEAPLLPVPAAAAIEDETLPLGSRSEQSNFRVAGGLISIESPEARMRNVVLYERDALLRVAAKRAFAKREITIAQFGSMEDVRRAVNEWYRTNSFFITVLEVGDGSPALLRDIKRKNGRLPVAMIDSTTDLQRRHDLIRSGADFYLSKPPTTNEADLKRFAEELVMFAEHAFDQWEQLAAAWGADAGKRFYEQAERERTERSYDVLKQFIADLSNPNDIAALADTIMRLAAEYLDRSALFIARYDAFIGLGEAAAIRIPRDQPSILADVADRGEAHRGKIRRTPLNEKLLATLGGDLPTEVVALPIVHDGRTLGILYGDNARHRAPIEPLTGLEVFLSQAGYAFGKAIAASVRNGASS
jgi:DNA-binding NarL/FixJ family response regulator